MGHSAGVRDLAALVDHIGRSAMRSSQVGGVIHIVDPEGQGIFLPLYEIFSDGYALLQRFWLR